MTLNEVIGKVASVFIAGWFVFIGFGILYTIYLSVVLPICHKIKEWKTLK